MTKSQLIRALSESEGIRLQDAKAIIEIILESIAKALIWGGNDSEKRFGEFFD